MSKITYGDLPIREVCEKLSMVSFSTPKKNLDVYRFCSAAFQHHDFLGNERRKLIEKYGIEVSPGKYDVKVEPFNNAFKAVLSMEVPDEIPDHGLTEADFEEKECEYPKAKHLWLSANDIMTVLKFSEKLKQEKEAPEAE